MSWFTDLRFLVYLRRGVRAIESLAESQRTLARIAEEDQRRQLAPKMVQRKAEFGTLDIAEVNKRYRLQQEAQMIAVPDEGEE